MIRIRLEAPQQRQKRLERQTAEERMTEIQLALTEIYEYLVEPEAEGEDG
jgi:hypothetical protein